MTAALLTVLAASSFWFQTPSHNIACVGDSKAIRCDTRFVTKFSQPVYKPKGCDVDWGPLGMGPRSRVHVLCVGDTALNPRAKVLPYGSLKVYGGAFRCTSRRAGLRCRNRAGHGFFISRQKQSLF